MKKNLYIHAQIYFTPTVTLTRGNHRNLLKKFTLRYPCFYFNEFQKKKKIHFEKKIPLTLNVGTL